MSKLLVVVIALAGCASAKSEAPRAAREVVSGAGSVRGGGVRMDVTVGHGFAQTAVKTTSATVQPATPVVP